MGRIRDAISVFTGRSKAVQGDELAGIMSMIRQKQMPRRGTREALEAYKTIPYFHAVNWLIGSSLAAVPWSLHRPARRKGTRSVMRDIMACADIEKRARIQSRAIQSGDMVEIEKHPFLDMKRKPGPKVRTWSRFILTQSLHYEITGTAYWAMERNLRGHPAELWPLPPSDKRQAPHGETGTWDFSGRDYAVRVPAANMIVRTDPDPLNPFSDVGAGRGLTLAHEIDSDEEAAKTQAARFHAGGAPDMAIFYENADPADVDAAETSFMRKFAGGLKSHRAWFSNQKPTIEKLGYNFAELDLVKLREYFRSVVHQVHGIPPELMGIIENSNRATIEAAFYLFTKAVQVPRLESLRDDLWLVLHEFGEDEDGLLLWYDSPVPEDLEFRLRVMQGQQQWWSGDEFRDLIGDSGLEGDAGKMHMTPMNLIPVKPAEMDWAAGKSADADPPWVADLARRAPPPAEKAAPDPRIEQIVARLTPERLEGNLRDLWDPELTEWMASALKDIGAEVSFDLLNPLIREHLEQLGVMVRGRIVPDKQEGLRQILSRAVAEGQGVRDMQAEVRRHFDGIKGWEARRIARTETHGSAQWGKVEAWQASGLVEGKQWEGDLAGDFREHHSPGGAETIHGQTRGLRELFQLEGGPNAGATAPFPGGFGIPEEDINCTCDSLPVIDEPEQNTAFRSRYIKSAKQRARQMIRWERRAIAAVGDAADAWQDDVLAAIEQAFPE